MQAQVAINRNTLGIGIGSDCAIVTSNGLRAHTRDQELLHGLIGNVVLSELLDVIPSGGHVLFIVVDSKTHLTYADIAGTVAFRG